MYPEIGSIPVIYYCFDKAAAQRPFSGSGLPFLGIGSNCFTVRSDEWLTLETSAFRISVRWPIYIINSVDKTKFLYTTSPPTQHHSFFRNYPFITVIIDCFEVFIEKPTNLIGRAQTFSNYKHHNTIRILIGITPQGSISFVSEAWGGRTSDKFLTENCGFLNKLLPGDMVMADRGSTISESVGLKQAELAIPAFTKGKAQLDPIDVEKTRGIANVRIHVERVIGLLRNK